jgi:hypothetical protein
VGAKLSLARRQSSDGGIDVAHWRPGQAVLGLKTGMWYLNAPKARRNGHKEKGEQVGIMLLRSREDRNYPIANRAGASACMRTTAPEQSQKSIFRQLGWLERVGWRARWRGVPFGDWQLFAESRRMGGSAGPGGASPTRRVNILQAPHVIVDGICSLHGDSATTGHAAARRLEAQ